MAFPDVLPPQLFINAGRTHLRHRRDEVPKATCPELMSADLRALANPSHALRGPIGLCLPWEPAPA